MGPRPFVSRADGTIEGPEALIVVFSRKNRGRVGTRRASTVRRHDLLSRESGEGGGQEPLSKL